MPYYHQLLGLPIRSTDPSSGLEDRAGHGVAAVDLLTKWMAAPVNQGCVPLNIQATSGTLIRDTDETAP